MTFANVQLDKLCYLVKTSKDLLKLVVCVAVSAVSLAAKCSASAFRMHIRAHDTFMKMLSALHDAAQDSVCDSVVVFLLTVLQL